MIGKSIAILFLNFVLTTTLTSINLQRVVMYATGLGVMVNIVLNLLVIPTFSYVGASYVMVATELTTFSICFYYASKSLCFIRVQRVLGNERSPAQRDVFLIRTGPRRPALYAGCIGEVFAFRDFGPAWSVN